MLNFIKKISDKFLDKKRRKIVFSSDETVIFEENAVFQAIENEGNSSLKYLELYIKKLKSFSWVDIFIGSEYFKTFETETENDEIPPEKTEKFIEYETKIFLNEEKLDDYFIKYFMYTNSNKFIIYILDRDFVENLIEFFLKNKIKAGEIFLDEENHFVIDDYDTILKRENSFSINKKGAGIMVFTAVVSAGLYLYNSVLEDKITELDKKTVIAEENLNTVKLEEDRFTQEIENLKTENEKFLAERELFSEKILKVLKFMPENITAEKIYYEKGFFNIQGRACDENSLFDFSEILEQEKNISSVKYDYIIQRENSFEFLLELRV